MAKSRKDLFEEQLRDLQKDISTLNQKLSAPPTKNDHSVNKMSKSGIDLRSQGAAGSINNVLDSHSPVLVQCIAPVVSQEVTSVVIDKSSTAERLQHDLHVSNRQRDDAVYRLEQAKVEIEQLRKGLQEYSRLKASFDHLKQDNDSIRISLESSERIRKQQKELIALLQRSHAMSASHIVDGNSVISAASESCISSIAPSDEVHNSSRLHESTHNLRQRNHSLGSVVTADSLPSFNIGEDSYHNNHKEHYSAVNNEKQPVINKVRRKAKTSLTQSSNVAANTTKNTSFIPNGRVMSAPPAVVSSSKHNKTGKSRPTKQTQSSQVQHQQSQYTPPPSIYHANSHDQHYMPTQQQQHQQQLQFQQQFQQHSHYADHPLSYQSILQQNPSLVPPTLLSAAHEASILSNNSSALLNNSSYSTSYTTAARSNSFDASTASDPYLRPPLAVQDGQHYMPEQQHQFMSTYAASSGDGPGRPPRHPSSTTLRGDYPPHPPPPSSSSSSSKNKNKTPLSSPVHISQNSPRPPQSTTRQQLVDGGISPHGRIDNWGHPTGSPYSLPSYSAFSSHVLPVKNPTLITTPSRTVNKKSSITSRGKKTNPRSPSTSNSSTRLIHVSVPSPATTFGASQRRF